MILYHITCINFTSAPWEKTLGLENLCQSVHILMHPGERLPITPLLITAIYVSPRPVLLANNIPRQSQVSLSARRHPPWVDKTCILYV